MPCETETLIPTPSTAPTNTMQPVTIDDATPCVDAQIEPGAGDWIGYQVTGLTEPMPSSWGYWFFVFSRVSPAV